MFWGYKLFKYKNTSYRKYNSKWHENALLQLTLQEELAKSTPYTS